MPHAGLTRTSVVLALAATTAMNMAFLVADPRLGHLEPWLAVVFVAGGVAYVAAIPLCVRRMRSGFVLASFVGVAGAAVAAWDNLAGAPNGATVALNWAVVVLAVPLVMGSFSWLRAGGAGLSALSGTALPGKE